MKTQDTLYSNSNINFRKILVYIFIIIVSIFFNLKDSEAFYSALFVQALCNLDGFLDYLENKNLNKSTRKNIRISAYISVMGAALSIGKFMVPSIIIYNDTWEFYVKIVALITVIPQLVILHNDYSKNIKNEEEKED